MSSKYGLNELETVIQYLVSLKWWNLMHRSVRLPVWCKMQLFKLTKLSFLRLKKEITSFYMIVVQIPYHFFRDIAVVKHLLF